MPKRRLSYDEMARIEDEKVAEGREAEGVVRVPGIVNPDLQHVIQLTFTSDEMARIGKRARAKGMQVGPYMRKAILGTSHREEGD